MYSRDFFETYWRGNLRSEVFVAMPFGDEFDPIFEDAIRPAIETDLTDADGSFKANRVDKVSTISEDIHTRILDGIGHATLVFADISVMTRGSWRWQRNGNVMFELGIAQTLRPATDLIVVKSDRKNINFDLSHIRVHQYERKNLPTARALFANLMKGALQQRVLEKSLLAQRLRDRLDVDSMNLMVQFCPDGKNFKPFTVRGCTADQRRAAARLLDLDIIRCVTPSARKYYYEWTDFGKHCYHNPNLK